MEKKKTGRKPKLTAELSREICEYIASGLTKRGACSAACVSESAFFEWISKGQADRDCGRNTVYGEFMEAVKKAEAKFKLTHIKNIKTAAEAGNWTASAWLLERTYREEYGKTSMDVNLGGQVDGEPIKTESYVQIYLPSNNRD